MDGSQLYVMLFGVLSKFISLSHTLLLIRNIGPEYFLLNYDLMLIFFVNLKIKIGVISLMILKTE